MVGQKIKELRERSKKSICISRIKIRRDVFLTAQKIGANGLAIGVDATFANASVTQRHIFNAEEVKSMLGSCIIQADHKLIEKYASKVASSNFEILYHLLPHHIPLIIHDR